MRHLKKFNENLEDDLRSELSFIIDYGFKYQYLKSFVLDEVCLDNISSNKITINDIKDDLLSFIEYRINDIKLYDNDCVIRVCLKDPVEYWSDFKYNDLKSKEFIFDKYWFKKNISRLYFIFNKKD